MKIKLNEFKGLTVWSLVPGDCFVRNASTRPLDDRCVYMVLHYHTRLLAFKHESDNVVVVNLRNGRVSDLVKDQPILKVNGGVEMEVVE